jgi:hypothetical protein
MFIRDLLANFLAAFLPSNDMIGAAYTVWAFVAYFAVRWVWQRIKGQRPGNRPTRNARLVLPLLLIGVCLAGALGGIFWLSRVTMPPIGISSPFTGLTANQLKERTFALTKELRNLEDVYQNRADAIRNQDWIERRTTAAAGIQVDKASSTERFWKKNIEAETIGNEMKAEYRRKFHVEANQVYEELCRRLKIEPAEFGHFASLSKTGLTEREYMGVSEMRTGQLAGAKPLHLSADALERLAMSL